MRAMVLRHFGRPLELEIRDDPSPGRGEVSVRVLACAVCRTDLHLMDGELPQARLPVVPGHEIVGIVDALGADANGLQIGQNVGIPWLGHACGHCRYCCDGQENLCDTAGFTGCTRDGGFASQVVAEAGFCLPLPQGETDAVRVAPLLCAGLIGWRSLKAAGDRARVLGLYGFGAAAHLVTQMAVQQGRRVHAFTRAGDAVAQCFARSLGAASARGSDETPPELLDAAILFAPAGELVPHALQAVRKGGRVVCGGIHMSDIPSFPYRLLWGERQLVSVANLTRADAHEFLAWVTQHPPQVRTTTYPLERANDAIDELRRGKLTGAAVLVP